MILYDSLSFLMLSDDSFIQKVNVKLLKINCFLLTETYEKMLTSTKIFTQSESIWWEPNSSEDFIQGLIVFIPLFAAEIYGFYIFADVSI